MFALHLNPMTSNTENSVCIAISHDRIMLENLLEDERVESYKDTGPNLFESGPSEKTYHKVYRKGSVLEMMNPPDSSFCEPCGIVEIPSLEDIREQYQRHIEHDTNLWNSLYGSTLHL